jgi:hypothetical protein
MMIHPEVQLMLARDRSAALRAAAEAYRRGRLARSAAVAATVDAAAASRPVTLRDGSAVLIRPVTLPDGSAVLIRPVRGADAALLADGFARLSERSRRQRFLGPRNTLPSTRSRSSWLARRAGPAEDVTHSCCTLTYVDVHFLDGDDDDQRGAGGPA